MTTLNDFETIVLDMNETFMFGGDRFSLTENYFQAYQKLGGDRLTSSQVSRIINGVYSTMHACYVDESQVDNFPSVSELLKELPESKLLHDAELDLLEEVFAIHELGDISDEHVEAIARLSRTHSLYLVSNIWSRKDKFREYLKEKGVERHFRSMVFSSDTRSVKPSANLFRSLSGSFNTERALFVGDSLRCDVKFAEKIGVKSVWLSHGREFPEGNHKPDFVTSNLLSLVHEENLTDCDGNLPEENIAQSPSLEEPSTASKTQIESQLVRFRQTELADLDYVLQAENDADNSPFIVNWPRQQHLDALADDDVEHLIIESCHNKEKVGYVILRGLAVSHGPVELKRIVIAAKHNGYGLASLNLLKEYVFQILGRQRLWLNVLTNNTRARRVYFKAGFRYEGTCKDAFLTDHGYADLELLTALASDTKTEHVFKINSDEFRITRILSDQHRRQLYEMYDNQWPNPTRTHADLEQALLGSEVIVGIIKQSTDELVGFCRVISDRGFRAWIHGVLVREDLRGLVPQPCWIDG